PGSTMSFARGAQDIPATALRQARRVGLASGFEARGVLLADALHEADHLLGDDVAVHVNVHDRLPPAPRGAAFSLPAAGAVTPRSRRSRPRRSMFARPPAL